MGFAIGGAVLGGSLLSSNAASDAANTMSNAAGAANATTLAMYNQTRDDNAPWRQAGTKAITDLSNNTADYTKTFSPSDFHQDPGYQFSMDQGTQAIERSAAARGLLGSSATLKGLTQFAQGTADQQYQSAYDRFNADRDQKFNKLSSIAGIGQVANGQTATAGTAAANSIGQNITGAANAQGAATVAGANAINSAIGTGANSWMNFSAMNKGNGGAVNPAAGFTGSTNSGYFANNPYSG